MFQPELSVSLNKLSTEVSNELISLLEQSTIDSFELALNCYSENDISLLQDAVLAERIKISSIHSKHGQQLAIATDDINLWENTLSEHSKAINIANDLNASVVVLHGSSDVESGDRSLMISFAQKALFELSKRVQNSTIKLALEYLPRTCIGNSQEELYAIIKDTSPDNVGICLDVNHVMTSFKKLPEIIHSLKNKLIEVHLSDYDGIDEKHWLPGKGVIDWKCVMNSFSDINYTGLFNYEAAIPGNSVQDKISTLEKNFSWLCNILLE